MFSDIIQNHYRWLSQDGGGIRANLSDSDLSDADLRGVDLSYCICIGTNFNNSIMSNSRFVGAHMTGSDLERVDLSRSNISYARIDNTVMDFSTLRGCNISGTIFDFSRITHSNLTETEQIIQESSFVGSDLRFSSMNLSAYASATKDSAELTGVKVDDDETR